MGRPHKYPDQSGEIHSIWCASRVARLRAVNTMCTRVAADALGWVDLLDGLIAVAIDEVKYKKGHEYLTVVCDHTWASSSTHSATKPRTYNLCPLTAPRGSTTSPPKEPRTPSCAWTP